MVDFTDHFYVGHSDGRCEGKSFKAGCYAVNFGVCAVEYPHNDCD